MWEWACLVEGAALAAAQAVPEAAHTLLHCRERVHERLPVENAHTCHTATNCFYLSSTPQTRLMYTLICLDRLLMWHVGSGSADSHLQQLVLQIS